MKKHLTVLLFLFLSVTLNAQFYQQGPKLVGPGSSEYTYFGQSVSISSDGNTAIVGGYGDDYGTGAAWVYTRQNGVWTQQGNKLIGTGAVGDALQGTSVSISADGNTAIIGGFNDNNGLGAAWIFTRQNGVWTQQGNKLVGSGAVGSAYQGWSVAMSADGNTAVIGGLADNDSLGAVWIFAKQNGVWTQQGSKLIGTGAVGHACQGQDVAISADGNTVIEGGINDNNYQGATWVFVRQNGVWSQQGSKLFGTGVVGNAQQGFSVALSADGNTALIGGLMDNHVVGASWVFIRQNGVWMQQGGKLVGTGPVGSAGQGGSVSLSSDGNLAMIGADWDDNNKGAVWAFKRQNGVWTQLGGKLVGTGTVGASMQGRSVSLNSDGTTVIVGGFYDNNNIGAAWVYCSSPIEISANAGAGGTISPSGNIPVNPGASLTFSITPDSGYHIQDVVVDDVSKGAIGTYTFTDVFGNHTISAQFAINAPEELPIPVAGSPKGGVILYTNTPTLNWSVGGNTTGLTFRIKYSTDPNNGNANGDLHIIDAGSSTSYTLPALQWGKTYYWQVQSVKGNSTSAYSPIESFRIEEEQVVIVPPCPIAAWPLTGSAVYFSNPPLTWYMLSGWCDVDSYTLRWGEGTNLNNVINGIKSMTYLIQGLLPGHTYSWTVESVSKSGNHSVPSGMQTFTTSGGTNNKPYIPVQIYPVGGTLVYSTSPVLTWYVLQEGFKVTSYKVRYSKNPDMTNSVELSTNGPVCAMTLTGLEKGRNYYWQVQSFDGQIYSEPQTPPACFTIYSDQIVMTPVILSPQGSVGLKTTSVDLCWAVNGNSKNMTYDLQYSSSPDFSSPVEVNNISEPYYKAANLGSSTYYWRVKSKTNEGVESEYSPVGKFSLMSVTGLAIDRLNKEEFTLLQNYPNPFNPTTSIVFNLPEESYITLEVYNSIGKSVGKLFEGQRPKGVTSMQFNAGDLPSGIYFYKIIAVGQNGRTNYDIKKMLLLK